MPDKPKKIAFDVPSDVKTATQSGWVYRSAADTAPPAPATPPASAPHELSVRPRAAAQATWGDRVTDLLVAPFTLPFCLILSLLPQSRRTHTSK